MIYVVLAPLSELIWAGPMSFWPLRMLPNAVQTGSEALRYFAVYLRYHDVRDIYILIGDSYSTERQIVKSNDVNP